MKNARMIILYFDFILLKFKIFSKIVTSFQFTSFQGSTAIQKCQGKTLLSKLLIYNCDEELEFVVVCVIFLIRLKQRIAFQKHQKTSNTREKSKRQLFVSSSHTQNRCCFR